MNKSEKRSESNRKSDERRGRIEAETEGGTATIERQTSKSLPLSKARVGEGTAGKGKHFLKIGKSERIWEMIRFERTNWGGKGRKEGRKG